MNIDKWKKKPTKKELIDIIKNQEEVISELHEVHKHFLKLLDSKDKIIKEVREWAKKCSCQFTNDDGELVVSEISFNIQARPCDLFKILDKENNNE